MLSRSPSHPATRESIPILAPNRISHRSLVAPAHERFLPAFAAEGERCKSSIASLDPRSHWQRSWRRWCTLVSSPCPPFTPSLPCTEVLSRDSTSELFPFRETPILPSSLSSSLSFSLSLFYSIRWKFTSLSTDSLFHLSFDASREF